jgi:arylsulfatase A-like enzyme
LGLLENTLIIFSSDNGATFNGGTDSPWFDSSKPFKSEAGWGKGNVNEGGIRVPMIAHWPGKIKAGTSSGHISAFYDVLPTICEINGIEPVEKTDGISFLPSLLGKENQTEHEYLYWEFPESGGQQAVRMGKWKGIRKNIKQDSLRVQLYNLEEDIQELNDVSAQNPEIVQKIESIFKQEHTPAEIERFKMKQLGD